MATLGDLAKLVRSKNAGPFWLTIDIMFDDAEAYRRARDAEIVNRATIARLYNRHPAEIIVVNHDTALAIKVSFPPSSKLGLQARQRCLRRPAIRAAAGTGRPAGLISRSIRTLPAVRCWTTCWREPDSNRRSRLSALPFLRDFDPGQP